MASELLKKYEPVLDIFQKINQMLTVHQPYAHAKDAVRGNYAIVETRGLKKLSSIYHSYFRKWGYKMGDLVDVTFLPKETQGMLTQWRALNIEYKNEIAKPLLDLFEEVNGKGSAWPKKQDTHIRSHTSFQNISTMISDMEVSGRPYDIERRKALTDAFDAFNQRYKIFMNVEFSAVMDAPQNIKLVGQDKKSSIIIPNIMLDITMQDDHKKIEPPAPETSVLNYLLMLKQGGAAFADMNVISPQLRNYVSRRIHGLQMIPKRALRFIREHEEFQNEPVLECFHQTLLDIRAAVDAGFERRDLAVLGRSEDYVASSLEMLRVYDNFTEEDFDVDDYIAELRRKKEAKRAGADQFFVDLVVNQDEEEETPKPTQTGGCPFGYT